MAFYLALDLQICCFSSPTFLSIMGEISFALCIGCLASSIFVFTASLVALGLLGYRSSDLNIRPDAWIGGAQLGVDAGLLITAILQGTKLADMLKVMQN